ncbi:transposase [Cysteiniphilum halobium]|uniref:transposase n=1 Tax=Cysteiniphilum halobium TaxID=2219059 RepID=UPI001AAD0681|nr:transposase [Cysteiniphilum halobium]
MSSREQNRHSIRLSGYDYSQEGMYFVTTCTQDRACLFGDIVNGKMILNELGDIVRSEWLKIEAIWSNVKCDAFVVMPNHFHGVVVITNTVGAIHELPLHELPLQMTIKQRRNMLLPKIIGRFKMQVSKQVNLVRGMPGQKLWQRNYYEHVVRDEDDYLRIYEYIDNNPLQWELDSLHPQNL